ncbi:hypothetical protein MSG28_005152, partial [Choristoneura fumiferana]
GPWQDELEVPVARVPRALRRTAADAAGRSHGGYYADTLSVDEEVRGNATVSVKDEARGFHLNNLSYAGPIVMGFGGYQH